MFKFHRKNVNSILPSNWDQDIIDFVKKNEKTIILTSNSVTSREEDENQFIKTLTVDGIKIKESLPWIYDLYRGTFFEIAKSLLNLDLVIATNPLYAINFNIQRGADMRYECHVDSNPVQGLLYVTTHTDEDGGSLIISNKDNVFGVEEISKDCTIIRPVLGDLVFFDARQNPHYVEPLKQNDGLRIAVTMNFYTTDSPEIDRPEDLDQHLFK